MFQKNLVINNESGLHARPATELVEFCSKFKSEVILTLGNGEDINAKSIISILSEGVYSGARLTLQVEGPDEDTAGPKVADFLAHLPD